MSVEKQKQVANEILSKLEAIDPYCIVAGGAPRDWYFGNEAKDIDVFLYVPRHHTPKGFERQLKAVGITFSRVKAGKDIPANYKMNPDLVCVYDVEGFDVPIQIMRMSNPTFDSVLPKFALSVCKAWYKNGVCTYEKDFKVSVKHKAIYKTNELYNNEHTYLERIKGKFSEYKYYKSKQEFLESLLDV